RMNMSSTVALEPPPRWGDDPRHMRTTFHFTSFLALWLLACGPVARAAEWPSDAAMSAAARKLDVGGPAPAWLVQSETYCFSPQPADWAALAASKVAFVTH